MLFLVAVLMLQASAERLIDMSHSVGEHSAIFIGYRPFERTKFHKGWQNAEKNLWIESFDVSFNEHMSTHMDAPRHFNPDKKTVDEIPIEDLVGPAIAIDMKERAASQDNAELAMEDVQKWIDENGPIPDKAIIFVNTGWGVRYHNKTAYFGTDTNETSNMRFPGLSIEVAKFFANHYNETGRRIVGVGIDTPSLDPGNSTTYPAHVILQAEDIFLLEHVANIEELPAIGAESYTIPTSDSTLRRAKMLFLVAVLMLQASAERLIDMSHSVGEHSSIFVGYRPFERTRFHKGWQNDEKNLWVESFDVSFNEHMSTHMDAPRHFNPDKKTVDEIPIEDLVGPGNLILVLIKLL
ncbi:Kynurenine formamidase [Trinorchestia longiramus]|nr:Kynurenine formamidase [Trinorchestia longiramus]